MPLPDFARSPACTISILCVCQMACGHKFVAHLTRQRLTAGQVLTAPFVR